MEIWGFMSPDMRVKQGKCVPKNSRHEFFTPPDVVFFRQILQHIREGNVYILKNYTKEMDVTAGKKGANTAGDARIYLSTRDSRVR